MSLKKRLKIIIQPKNFDNLTSINSVYYCTYLAIVEGKTKYYINLFNESSVKLENLFDLNSYIKSINFHQFDIAFISMLCFNDKDKNTFVITLRIFAVL